MKLSQLNESIKNFDKKTDRSRFKDKKFAKALDLMEMDILKNNHSTKKGS